MKKVAIIMGSDSDLPVVEKAINTLVEFGVPHEVHVFSAHRTPEESKEFSQNAAKNGFDAVNAIIPAGAETELKVGMLFAILFPIGMIAGMALLKKMTAKTK